ncbi:MAG: RNA pseudouridine synthase [Spirochaetaceae bacterium]|jgi:23S rRNA pseudouridine1911/1915/1917 synthase|nr:RNA pseudouridine synthase [Spirochaetaceae bacterium]
MTAPLLAERMVYRSGRYFVVNKLPGEAVEGGRAGMADLPPLLQALSPGADIPPLPAGETPIPPRAVNRLDVPVSGLCLFARTREAFIRASEQFRERTTEKRYWAIVEPPLSGPLPVPEGREMVKISHWLVEDPRQNRSVAHDKKVPGGKYARLYCRAAGRGDRYLFLEILLVTGRHHQIRAQLRRLGLCVKGDLKYGARRSEKNGGIRLHASSLHFDDGDRARLFAPPPVMDRLWEACAAAIAGMPPS